MEKRRGKEIAKYLKIIFADRFCFYFTRFALFLCPLTFLGLTAANVQNTACPFDEKTLQFVGTPKQQALCLLRPVQPRGILGVQMLKLPKILDNLIGEPVKFKKEKLRKFLAAAKIAESAVGGSLDENLSFGELPDGTRLPALYFVIHDVSAPNYSEKPFPPDVNAPEWEWNDLARWEKQKVAHVFVNRRGESISAVEFGSVLPEKRFGTKFARDFLKVKAKGLQIHVELVQPRRSDPLWFKGNDAIAPIPGFTREQYERLALLYAAASARRGSWLIPAFHCAVDVGIPDAHDDPQNFELENFAAELEKLLGKI